MNSVLNTWLSSDLGRFLLGAFFSCSAIGLFGVLFGLSVRKCRTEWRLLAVRLSILGAFAALVVSALGIWLPTTGFTAPTVPERLPDPGFSFGGMRSADLPQYAGGIPVAIPEEPVPFEVTPIWVALTWLGVALVALARLLTYSIALRRWLKPRRRWGLLYAGPVAAPFCGGAFQPFLLIPGDFRAVVKERRRAVFAHEAAHLRLGHPAWKLLADLLVCVLWWIPFAYAFREEQDNLHERQCDEYVVRRMGSGLPLARGLVWFAERSLGSIPSGALSILRPGSPLEDRVRRLTTIGDIPMQPKKAHLTLAAVGLGVAMSALAFTLQVRPDALVEAKRYLPSKPGTVLTYRTVFSDERAGTRRFYSLGEKPAQPYPVLEFHYEPVGRGHYSYWMATPQGLREVDGLGMRDEPGFDLSRQRGIILPLPLKVGHTWKWSEEFRGQTMAGPNGEVPEIPPTHYAGKVIAVDQEVKVPAGTYRAAVIEISAHGSSYGYGTRTYWVKDVGMVKKEYFDIKGKVTGSEELVVIGRR